MRTHTHTHKHVLYKFVPITSHCTSAEYLWFTLTTRWTNDKYPPAMDIACVPPSPHPHLTRAFTYAHPKLQAWFTDTHHTSIPTCVTHRTFPHYSYHVYTLIYKNTINEHLHTTKWEGPSHFHHNPISHTIHIPSLVSRVPYPTQPVPHPSHAIQSVLTSRSSVVTHTHTHIYTSEHTHTLVHPQGCCWHVNYIEEKPSDTITSKVWKQWTRCVKEPHLSDWSFAAARSS